MNIPLLNQILETEPRYRQEQVYRLLYKEAIENWDSATTLPKQLRQRLVREIPLSIAGVIQLSEDKDSEKAIITFADGARAEAVLMRHNDGRNTVCVSCQIGCPLGCVFCATGKMGFTRNLTEDEIVEQILFFARRLKISNNRVSNVVFMGMGEPFLNYEHVINSIKFINRSNTFGIGIRHISISTAGIVEGIERLAEEPLEINLALSLHASTDELRQKLMPIAKQYTLSVLLPTIDNYIKKTNRRVMFEYLMISGVNDSHECAEQLAEIARGRLCFINLIRYNPTGEFFPSTPAAIEEFKSLLEENGITVIQRHRFGTEIKGACGQLIAG